MQLLALALYHRDGRPTPRVLRFRPGALNILTGESETGKSEILDIVDYCLGRRQPSLPDEPIDQTVGWYALLVTFGDTRMVLARPRPTGASTIHAMIRTGDRPAFVDDAFIQGLRAREIDGVIARPLRPYEVGQQVRLSGGPFDGLIATIIEMDERERLVLLTSLLSQTVRLRVTEANVRAL